MYERAGGIGSLPGAETLLVEGLRRGCERAFERFVREYGPKIEATARRMLRDPEGARDVAQEVHLAVHRGIDRFRGDCRFGSWVHRIAVNRTLAELRRRRRRPELPFGEEVEGLADGPLGLDPSEPAAGPDAAFERRELARAVRRALGLLSESDRESLVLHYLEGCDAREVAHRLGLSGPATKSRIHRARRRLRERWRDAPDAGPDPAPRGA